MTNKHSETVEREAFLSFIKNPPEVILQDWLTPEQAKYWLLWQSATKWQASRAAQPKGVDVALQEINAALESDKEAMGAELHFGYIAQRLRLTLYAVRDVLNSAALSHPAPSLAEELEHLRRQPAEFSGNADEFNAYLANPAPQDEVKSVGVDFYRDAWIQEQENCIKAYELLAPHLGLKPYKCNANKEQIIWAESQEHANEVRIGESVFKYVKSAISKYHMTERN